MSDPYVELTAGLRNAVSGLADHQRQYWLAIVGAPGAGKSTCSEKLRQRFGDDAVIIPMDGYHFYRSQLDAMPDPETAHRRRGAPFTFDSARFVKELCAARRKGTGVFPSFQHGIGDPLEKRINLDPNQHRLVIVEGNYLLLDEEPWCQLQSLFDESWYLDVDVAVIRKRLVQRFTRAGMSESAALRRVESNDLQNAELVRERCRPNASRIVCLS